MPDDDSDGDGADDDHECGDDDDDQEGDEEEDEDDKHQLALGLFLQHLNDPGMRRSHVCQIVRPHAVEEMVNNLRGKQTNKRNK